MATVTTEIEAAIDAFSKAMWNRDLDALQACYADDVRVFDVFAQVNGYEELRKLWESCFPYLPDQIAIERKDIRIQQGDKMAVVTFLTRIAGIDSESSAARSWLRATVCLEKQSGSWKIIHDHISLPVNCETGSAMYLLDDE